MNAIQRKITLTGDYQRLSAAKLEFTGDISATPGNARIAYFLGDDGTDIPWQPGEWHGFTGIDLYGVQVKGTSGDTITIVGGGAR